ncbi:hypothetical protein [Hominibacterium faecale]|uniref:hypothetical protein n=1 Tax=Hominibacterium faecale TaxID=2839743 RepID=UPI0022B2A971|nr:hypothetical protein [Hominibacterium faecale]
MDRGRPGVIIYCRQPITGQHRTAEGCIGHRRCPYRSVDTNMSADAFRTCTDLSVPIYEETQKESLIIYADMSLTSSDAL